MKSRATLLVFIILFGCISGNSLTTASETSWQKPILKSFTFTPTEIELSSENTEVEILLTVTHPSGISNQTINIYLKNSTYGGNFIYSTKLFRTESPINSSLTIVNFKGSLKLDPTIFPGVWIFSSDAVTANPILDLPNFVPKSSTFTPPPFRDFEGAEAGLLIRRLGNLSFDFQTFVGPSHPTISYFEDGKPTIFPMKMPIWRVKESYDPKDFFQLRTNRTSLQITSLSPLTCSVNSSILNFISTGDCQFKVFTQKTTDFVAKELFLNVEILPERNKVNLNLPTIPTQLVTEFPKTISRSVITLDGAEVSPVSDTPTVCSAFGNELTMYLPGNCVLSYSTVATESRLASGIIKQAFIVLQEGVVEPRPSPTASPTASPKSPTKNRIICAKGKTSKKVSGDNPKCPKGYKLKK